MQKQTMFEAKLFDQCSFPQLMTAEEAAKYCHITPRRLIEFAKSGIAPCVIIDEDTYLFFKTDLLSWAKKNLVRAQPGQDFDFQLNVISGTPAEVHAIPDCLIPVSHRLKTLGNFGSNPVIYFLVKGASVVYVGQSLSLGGRISSHSNDKDFDYVLYFHYPKEFLNKVEAAFIRVLRPKYNVALVTDAASDSDKETIAKLGAV